MLTMLIIIPLRCVLWIGTNKGEILVRDMDNLDCEVDKKCLRPQYMEGADHQTCRFIATPVSMASSCRQVWAYIFPGLLTISEITILSTIN